MKVAGLGSVEAKLVVFLYQLSLMKVASLGFVKAKWSMVGGGHPRGEQWFVMAGALLLVDGGLQPCIAAGGHAYSGHETLVRA